MHTFLDMLNLAIIWSLDFLAIGTNLLLIGVIILRTPPPLRKYSIFLLSNALVDLASAVASGMVAVRVIENHETYKSLFVFLGPCSMLNEYVCRLCQAIHVNLVNHSSIILLLSFIYRLHLIQDAGSSRSPFSSITIWALCSLPLMVITPLIGFYYLEETDLSEAERSHFGLPGYTVSSYAIFSTRALIVNSVVGSVSLVVTIMIFVVRRMLMARISLAKSVDKRTHELIARMMSMFPMASPIINFTMIPPYRAMLPCTTTRATNAVAPSDFTTAINSV